MAAGYVFPLTLGISEFAALCCLQNSLTAYAAMFKLSAVVLHALGSLSHLH